MTWSIAAPILRSTILATDMLHAVAAVFFAYFLFGGIKRK
jgi:hypothetical protein